MFKEYKHVIIMGSIVFLAASCYRGPVRYKVAGYNKSVAINMLHSENRLISAAFPLGMPMDLGIILADSLWSPFVAFNIASPHPLQKNDPELDHPFIPFYSLFVRPKMSSGSLFVNTLGWTVMKLALTPVFSYLLLTESESTYHIYFGQPWFAREGSGAIPEYTGI